MTGATVMRLGMAIAARLRQPGRHTRIVDRQGHAAVGLHVRVGARRRHRRRWAPTSGSPARCRRPGIAFITSSMRCDAGVVISRVAQPVRGQRHQDLRARRLQAARRRRGRDRGADGARPSSTRSAPRRPTSATAASIEDARGRYVVFCKSTFPTRPHARRPAHRRRRRARRRLPRRPRGVRGARREGHRDRHQARRQEHQRARRRAAPAGDVRDA